MKTPEMRAEELVRGKRGDHAYRVGVIVDEWRTAIAAVIAEAIAEERERCARVCEDKGDWLAETKDDVIHAAVAFDLAARIRKGE